MVDDGAGDGAGAGAGAGARAGAGMEVSGAGAGSGSHRGLLQRYVKYYDTSTGVRCQEGCSFQCAGQVQLRAVFDPCDADCLRDEGRDEGGMVSARNYTGCTEQVGGWGTQ